MATSKYSVFFYYEDGRMIMGDHNDKYLPQTEEHNIGETVHRIMNCIDTTGDEFRIVRYDVTYEIVNRQVEDGLSGRCILSVWLREIDRKIL